MKVRRIYMVWEMMRAMAGPYLCSVVDFYLMHQDIFNSIVVGVGFLWILYDRKYRQDKKSGPQYKIMGMTIYGGKN